MCFEMVKIAPGQYVAIGFNIIQEKTQQTAIELGHAASTF